LLTYAISSDSKRHPLDTEATSDYYPDTQLLTQAQVVVHK
jgi:hypothetical protein